MPTSILPLAIVMIIVGCLNVFMAKSAATTNELLFRKVGFSDSFISTFCNEYLIRAVGGLVLAIGLTLLVLALI